MPPARPRDETPADLVGIGVCCLWATGADPRRDGLIRLAALRRDGDAWRRFELFVRPRGAAVQGDPGTEREERGADAPSATRRMQRELGVTAADLADAPTPEEAWAALLAFLGDGPLLVPRREEFEAWARALDADDNPFAATWSGAGRLLSLEEYRRLLAPGARPAAPPREPEDLLAAFADATADLADLPPGILALAARGLARVASGLTATAGEETAGEALVRALTLVEHPSAWAHGTGELFDRALEDGLLTRALEDHLDPDEALRKARPRWHLPFARLEEDPPKPPLSEGAGQLAPEDLERVDDIFNVHLPKRFAGDAAKNRPRVREGQRELANEIARRLGKRQLLLSHAPTGTGKTLAYLVPLTLWALRRGVRTGVATFTRALQDQAFEREVPLCLSLLKEAGVADEPRVTRLKGRHNYLCWRALRRVRPDEGRDVAEDRERAPELLAWTSALLFAATSPDGDLDAFPRGLALPVAADDLWLVARARLLRSIRAETGCCSSGRDRSTCGSEIARRRAERSHVVITNHSFVLARQEFLRHVVFDECEHLHDQARGAWSHVLSTVRLSRELGEVYRERTGAGPLGEVLGAAPDGSLIERVAHGAVERAASARLRLDALEVELSRYRIWRDQEQGRRDPRDRHGVFREFVQHGPSQGLVACQRELVTDLARLDAALSDLVDHMDELPSRKREFLRGGLSIRRLALYECNEALAAWLPDDEARADLAPRFDPNVFYDVAAEELGPGRGRGQARPGQAGHRRTDTQLMAQVLLPQEDLGRRYFPELESGVLLSATTWVQGGFQSAANYLGLARCAEPDEDEARDGRPFDTLKIAEVFDYGRVLVGVPRDAPGVRDRDAYLTYVTRFLAHLAERTRGRILCLFTNGRDLAQVGRDLTEALTGTEVPVYWQGMGVAKEELAERFRARTDSVLLGLDTFWYGADFPGETLEYLVLARLPYGVPDDYHFAQEASMGSREQRKRVYMPRSLARFRQGFGRLMRRESDRGCVFLLDKRVIEPRHRAFLKELPIGGLGASFGGDATDEAVDPKRLARLVRGETDLVLREAFAHMGMLPDIERRGLDTPFAEGPPPGDRQADGRGFEPGGSHAAPPPSHRDPDPPTDAPSIFFPTEEPPF